MRVSVRERNRRGKSIKGWVCDQGEENKHSLKVGGMNSFVQNNSNNKSLILVNTLCESETRQSFFEV